MGDTVTTAVPGSPLATKFGKTAFGSRSQQIKGASRQS